MIRRVRPALAALTVTGLLLAGCSATGSDGASDPTTTAEPRSVDPTTPAEPAAREGIPALPDDDPAARVEPVAGRDELQHLLDPAGLEIVRPVDLPGTDADAFLVEVPGREAVDAWADARALVADTGRYPVVVGGAEAGEYEATGLDQTLEGGEYAVDDGSTVDDALAAAEQIDAGPWLADRQDAMEIPDDELEIQPPLDPAIGSPSLASVRDLDGQPLETVQILLMPTSVGWEVPAYLLWGGWNDVPFPEEHVALMEHWNQAYGAQLFAMTSDVVEMVVAHPPVDDEAAIELAAEQYPYAPDLVWQGTETADVLASSLLDSPAWYFWWD